jgi:hypothetical protein
MNIRTTLLVLTFLIINSLTYAQTKTCECVKDFEFLATSYIKDYSGIQDFSQQHPDYLQTIDRLSKQSKSVKDVQQCDKIIGKLIAYINNGHVVYGQTKENPIYGKGNSKPSKGSLDPILTFLDSKTVLFQIKTCDLSYKNLLDSLVSVNKTKLDKTEHFILDLRGNEGGGDATFDTIIPYLYTNPILIHTTQLWSSENNIKMFDEFLNNPEIPADSKLNIQKIVSKAKNNPNSFVPLSENKVDTLIMNSTTEFPKKVSIIIDRDCKSSTEQFLLLAKQSKKTKIYGYTNSGGALDYSNLNFILTPSGYWYASVPTTRTSRLPDNPVDPNGIKPDVLVDKKVKDIILWLTRE